MAYTPATNFSFTYGSANSYDNRARFAFTSPDYMSELLGTTVLNDVNAPNSWGVIYYAVDGAVSDPDQ